jgi:predicted permease
MPDWTSEVRRRLAGLGISPEREAEIVDELSQHLADREAELRRSGVGVADAHRLALDEISDEALMRGEFRRLRQARTPEALAPGAPAGHSRFVERLWQDVRYGTRSLRQRPGFAAAATLALALGIGANSAIFAAVDAVLLRPMPFSHADRLYVPVSVNTARGIDQGSVTFADYRDWRTQTDVFAAVALWRPIGVDLTGDGEPERVEIAQVSEEFFRLADVTPLAGRTLVPADHEASAPRVAVITDGLWQRRFGGAADVVGRTIRIAGLPAEVVGVLPARSVWPDTSQMFVPLKAAAFNDDVRTRRDNMIFEGLVRLRDGVTAQAANARLGGMAARLAQDQPVIRKGWTNAVIPLRMYMVDPDLTRALYVLLGAVVAVLLIACANVANLALVRGSGRARELAIRLSLGASRRRLIQQLLVESVLLTTAGAAVGAGLAVFLMKGLVIVAPEGTPFLEDIHMNGRVLAATVLISAVAAVVSGLVPALSTSVVRPSAALRDGTGGSGASPRAARLRHVLIIGEIGAAVVLVTGAALLIRSFTRLSHVDPGVSLDRVVSARVSIPGALPRRGETLAVRGSPGRRAGRGPGHRERRPDIIRASGGRRVWPGPRLSRGRTGGTAGHPGRRRAMERRDPRLLPDDGHSSARRPCLRRARHRVDHARDHRHRELCPPDVPRGVSARPPCPLVA